MSTRHLGCGTILGILGLTLAGLLVFALVITRGHPAWLFWQTLRGTGLVNPATIVGPAGHGVLGIVERVEGNQIIVTGRSGEQVIILVSEATEIERVIAEKPGPRRERIQITMIQPGQRLIAFGQPDDQGRMTARAVRVFDARERPSLQKRFFVLPVRDQLRDHLAKSIEYLVRPA